MSTRTQKALTARTWRNRARDWSPLAMGTAVGVAALFAVGGCSREHAAGSRSVDALAEARESAAAGRGVFNEGDNSSGTRLADKASVPSSRTRAHADTAGDKPAGDSANALAEAEAVNSSPLPLAVIAARHSGSFTPEQTSSLVQLNEAFLKRLEADHANRVPGNATTTATTSSAGVLLTEGSSPEATGPSSAEDAADGADSQQREERSWNAAQSASDARFRSLFGYPAFNAMQLERARESEATATTRTTATTTTR